MFTVQNMIIYFIIMAIIATAVLTIYIYIRIRSDNPTDMEDEENKDKDKDKEHLFKIDQKKELLVEKEDLFEEIDYNKGLLN